jgi:hypothetical protein
MGKPLEYWRELERTAKKMNIADLVLENINHKAEIKRLKGKMHDAARSLWDHDREREGYGF